MSSLTYAHQYAIHCIGIYELAAVPYVIFLQRIANSPCQFDLSCFIYHSTWQKNVYFFLYCVVFDHLNVALYKPLYHTNL